jgi:hypothetical protein
MAAFFGLLLNGCELLTDAATRLGLEIIEQAETLRQETGLERRFDHQPRSWMEGCSGAYTVKLQESLHHPASGGSLLIGCKGSRNFRALGYSYSTTTHLNAVRAPQELNADKPADAPLRVTLRKHGTVIEVAAIE